MAESSSDTKKDQKDDSKPVYLISYPKIVFLYPSFLFAIFAGCFMLFTNNQPEADAEPDNGKYSLTEESYSVKIDVTRQGQEEASELAPAAIYVPTHTNYTVTLIFLFIFTFNLMVLAFDFPRTTSLTWFSIVAVLMMAAWLFFTYNPEMLPAFKDIFLKLKPFANATFFFLFAIILGVMYVAVAIAVRFDYWEVRPNELLHHHGFLSDLERLPAPHLRIDKEINDLFEYALLRSGRLIVHPERESRAIVLENVFFINKKEEAITQMLSALQVKVRVDDDY